MEWRKFLEHYEAGHFATREAAQTMLRYITEENKDEVLQALTCPYLLDCMKQLVDEWKDLTDEQWSKFLTVRLGCWIVRERRTGTTARQEAKDREEHQLMRRGVNILKGVEGWTLKKE